MDYYNRERTNQGRYCQGRTPYETFVDGLDLYQQYVFENPVVGEEVMQYNRKTDDRKTRCKDFYRSGHLISIGSTSMKIPLLERR